MIPKQVNWDNSKFKNQMPIPKHNINEFKKKKILMEVDKKNTQDVQ